MPSHLVSALVDKGKSFRKNGRMHLIDQAFTKLMKVIMLV